MNETEPIAWSVAFAWSLLLTVLTVVIHVYGLGVINKTALSLERKRADGRGFTVGSLALSMGPVTLLVTFLHAIESAVWAAAYFLLGALSDWKSSLLYSLNAITSYGHVKIELAPRWALMGGLESLNGWILFGLSTAFLFRLLQRAPLASE